MLVDYDKILWIMTLLISLSLTIATLFCLLTDSKLQDKSPERHFIAENYRNYVSLSLR